MGMLDRIKRRQMDGFKEFVQNMETTGPQGRAQIFTAGVLEDPVFMSWVMKNIRQFDDFLELPSEDIDFVLNSQDQILGVLAKSMFGIDETKIMSMESVIPRHMSKFKDELSYLKDVTPMERESARYFIMKAARKLQTEEKISGFKWNFPPQDIFHNKTYKDGNGKIHFENGVLAAEGEFLKGRRSGFWTHYYDIGKKLAEGDYHDGLKAGIWMFYYSNGEKRAEGKYKSDLRHGLWREWDRNGKISEIEYSEGVKKTPKT